MLVVIPITKCVARPDEDGRPHWLIDHLCRVAHATGDPAGKANDRLAFLAGLLHDAAKCHCDWQDYIDPNSPRKKGPPHAPFGAALFAFVAERLIPVWQSERYERQHLRDNMLNWLMAIQGHHGRLGDFNGSLVPWMNVVSKYSVAKLIPGCDLTGIFGLVSRHFPEFTANVQDFTAWLERFGRTWLKLVETVRPKIVEQSPAHEIAMRFPREFSRLIIADRIDAGNLPDDILEVADASRGLTSLENYCNEQAGLAIEKGASSTMVNMRRDIQDRVWQRYREASQSRFFTLLLPTGYGKTLSSLRVALESCVSDDCKRIIYVAPYLSILSQAAKEITAASQVEVFQHHHLSLAAMAAREDDPNEQSALRANSDEDVEILDTWKIPILATTFNQFFRALFPARAQHTLRIDAIKQAYIIIDEPQIIDVGVWNLFLRALSVFATDHDCRVLFATATLPPLELGLGPGVCPLAPNVAAQHRYDIQFIPEDLTTETLTKRVAEQISTHPNCAVVLNTVRDAAVVFQSLENLRLENTRLFCLTAMMLPGHKRNTIAEIAQLLEQQRKAFGAPKVIVVCTQMLEAGVDLSFRCIFRARSILPSIAQVAGRANRHGEGKPAQVFVFPFKADGESELRRFVYRDSTACEITDEILTRHPRIAEPEIRERLDEYYRLCWQQNTQTARLFKDFQTAALGTWSCLAELEPFGISPPRDEVFVPVSSNAPDAQSQNLIQRFGATDPRQLLDKYLDPEFMKSLSFRDRKLLHIALQLYKVPTRREIAERIAEPVNEWLWQIEDTDSYSNETGLAHWLVDSQETSCRQNDEPALYMF